MGRQHMGNAGRSIPALAGKPNPWLESGNAIRVYPRARGEASSCGNICLCYLGLSPRSRGSPHKTGITQQTEGSIPALAGKPTAGPRRLTSPWVYPRARGEACLCRVHSMYSFGLSPRSRGSPGLHDRPGSGAGSIPALAGKPNAGIDPVLHPRVYPRARGEAGSSATGAGCCGGLSPRSRGSRSRSGQPARRSGSIPALAGKPRGSSG